MLTNWVDEAKNFDDQYTESTPLKGIPFIGNYVKKDLKLRQDIITEILGDVNGKTILDLGCGVGRFAHYLANQGAYVIGYDISNEAIELANSYKDKLNLNDKCEFHTIDLEEIEMFPDADIWIGVGLWQYLINPIKILSKINDYPSFVTDLPRKYHWINPGRKVYRTMLKGIKFKSYTVRSVNKLLDKCGIINFNIDYRNPTIYIIYK